MPMLSGIKDGSYKIPRPKKTRQGRSARTLLSATSRNKAKKSISRSREIMEEIKTVEDYVKEIEIQAKKPISEQINDLKIAGATFLVKLDEYIRHLDQSNN